MTLQLDALSGEYAVARLAPDDGWPAWAVWSRPFVSLTRTGDETSVVCEAQLVPPDVTAERGFAAFRVRGTLPFSAVGILASISAPLATAGIPLLAIGTFETDVILVPSTRVVDARLSWRAAGIAVDEC